MLLESFSGIVVFQDKESGEMDDIVLDYYLFREILDSSELNKWNMYIDSFVEYCGELFNIIGNIILFGKVQSFRAVSGFQKLLILFLRHDISQITWK